MNLIVAAGDVRPGSCVSDGPVLRLHQRVRKDLRRQSMIYLTAAVSAFLFVYLFAALIRPNGSRVRNVPISKR